MFVNTARSQRGCGALQAPGRLVSWLKSRNKVFKVDKDYVSLKPNFIRKYNPAEFGPPGFPAQDKSAAHANPWQQGSRRNGEDQRILFLEEKILNWLAMKDKVTTTEMAEFAYAAHEELVPGAFPIASLCLTQVLHKSYANAASTAFAFSEIAACSTAQNLP